MTAAQQADAVKAAKRLRRDRALLSGTIGSESVDNVECAAFAGGGPDDFACSFILDGMEPSFFQVRRQADGSVTKLLAGHPPTPGRTTPAEAAELLKSDDEVQGAPRRTRNWSCSPSPRLEPDGQLAAAAGSGLICATYWSAEARAVERYVEFAPDGTARRDFVVQP